VSEVNEVSATLERGGGRGADAARKKKTCSFHATVDSQKMVFFVSSRPPRRRSRLCRDTRNERLFVRFSLSLIARIAKT